VFVNAVVNQLGLALDRQAPSEAKQADAEARRAAAGFARLIPRRAQLAEDGAGSDARWRQSSVKLLAKAAPRQTGRRSRSGNAR